MTKPVDSAGSSKESVGAILSDSVADILERELDALIGDWLYRVDLEPDLRCIPLSFEERTGHLPHLLHEVIARLRLDAGAKAPTSKAAAAHGDLRRKQGYTVAMMVEESRLLQVCIFTKQHKNANQVDAQLKEQQLRFMAANAADQVISK